MLNRNINSIIYQGYVKLGELAYDLALLSKEGWDSTAKQKKDWNKLIHLDNLLYTIAENVEVSNNQVYRIVGASESDINKLLTCIEQISDIHDYPIAPFLITRNITQLSQYAGSQGPPGSNGVSAYIAVVFAEDDQGTGLSSTPDITRPYIAFKTSNNPIPITLSTFTGLWIKYIGDPGEDGEAGEDGTDYFTYIRYASDETGTNFSATPDINRKYVAFLTTSIDYLNNPPSTLFTSLWKKYIGDNGAPGTPGVNGKTILITSGAPDNAIGSNGDIAIDTTNWYIYAPKANGVWPAGHQLTGPQGIAGATGAAGSNGTNGANAYLYIAWADDAVGNGFTTVFDPNKQWVAVLSSTSEIVSPNVSHFVGKWAKYRGDGDRWATTSTTPLTIGTGVKALIVGQGLAYSTGQRIVIAVDNDPNNRMEGLVIGYDQVTGQFTANITDVFGSGTFASWDVNLQGAPSSVLTADSYFAEIYVANNSAGTPQSLTTTPTKITQFAALGDISPSMAASHTNDNITPGAVGEFHIYANLVVSGTANAEFIVQLYKDGVAQDAFTTRGVLNASGDPMALSLEGLKSVIAGQVFELRVAAATGTPDFLVEEARFGMFTTGTPATPEYTKFGGNNFDTGTDVILDAFPTVNGDAVIWEYKVKKGNNIKTGRIQGCWDGLGNFNKDDSFSLALGTIDVVLDADINGGNVRLKANITSDDWEISGNRYIL